MTTIIPGVTIDTVADGDLSTGTLVGGAITRSSGNMAVSVIQSYAHSGIQLPSGMNVGDIVEIYLDITLAQTCIAFPPSGEDFGTAVPGNEPGEFGITSGARFRKLSSTLWGVQG